MAPERPHGRFLAGEAGELVGVSGTTIGQWARRGYIRASRSTGDPHVYSLEDVAEAWVVHALLERGVGHAQVRHAIAALGDDRPWPLLRAPLATTDHDGNGAPRIVLCEPDGVYALSGRGWQRLAVQPELRGLRPPSLVSATPSPPRSEAPPAARRSARARTS
jgi:DNA-binding transcriptional MerR regulator